MIHSIFTNDGLWYLLNGCAAIALYYTSRADPPGHLRDATMIMVGAHVGVCVHHASMRFALYWLH